MSTTAVEPVARCQATTKAGTRCQNPPREGSDYCFFHDPASAAEVAAARSRGGHARHGRQLARVLDVEQLEVQDMRGVLEVLSGAVKSTMALEPSISRNRALAYICGVAMKALEVAEIERRIAALERRLKRS